jgi:hypothetical protein
MSPPGMVWWMPGNAPINIHPGLPLSFYSSSMTDSCCCIDYTLFGKSSSSAIHIFVHDGTVWSAISFVYASGVSKLQLLYMYIVWAISPARECKYLAYSYLSQSFMFLHLDHLIHTNSKLEQNSHLGKSLGSLIPDFASVNTASGKCCKPAN